MCKVQQILASAKYNEPKPEAGKTKLTKATIDMFKENREGYLRQYNYRSNIQNHNNSIV